MTEHISFNWAFLFLGEVDFSIPYSSSYKTTEGIAISFGGVANNLLETLPMPLKK